jgi:hypothetical protein
MINGELCHIPLNADGTFDPASYERGEGGPVEFGSIDNEMELQAIRRDLTFPVGSRVRLKTDVERFPHFIAKAGLTGIVAVNDEDMLAVTMDEPLAGSEEWDNQVCWVDGDFECGNVADELEVIQ